MEPEKHNLTLSDQDAAAVDSLFVAPPSDGPVDPVRTQRVQAWLKTLDAAKVPAPSPDLLSRTLATVQQERMKLDPAAAAIPLADSSTRQLANSSLFRRHLADIAAMLVAACILVAVLIPAVAHAKYSYRRTLCAANLAAAGTAFSEYAINGSNQLPSLANTPGANWLHASPTNHTNTANLLPLMLASVAAPAYIQPTRFLCPGRDLPERSPSVSSTSNDIPDCDYSYTNLFSTFRTTWDGKSSTIILADRNPLFSANATINPDFNSINHNRNGNYVLRANRSVTWESSPNIGPGHDNIWTINKSGGGAGTAQRLISYTGTELPTTPNDVFLSP